MSERKMLNKLQDIDYKKEKTQRQFHGNFTVKCCIVHWEINSYIVNCAVTYNSQQN